MGEGGRPLGYTQIMIDFKNHVIKITLYVQNNTVCNCIYVHINIPMTQSKYPIFLLL
jgi:hypothetical protein